MNSLKYTKRTLLAPILVPAIGRLLRRTIDATVSIFMMHRFESPDISVAGHSTRILAKNLAYLRKERFQPVSLADVALGRTVGIRRPQVVFTVDDGYSDFRDVALPIFAHYDCPVSVFVATGVWDGQCWYWNDVISYAFAHTSERRLTLEVENVAIHLTWDSQDDAVGSGDWLNEFLKTAGHEARLKALSDMLDRLCISLPSTPPRKYATMTWDDARRCGETGLVTFGPHSVTHPVLPLMGAEEARGEIVESWKRVQSAGVPTVPIFVYPFGTFSKREVDVLARTDLCGALTTEHRYAAPDAFGAEHGRRRFAVSRLTYEEQPFDFLQAMSGIDRIKLGVRMGRVGWQTLGKDV